MFLVAGHQALLGAPVMLTCSVDCVSPGSQRHQSALCLRLFFLASFHTFSFPLCPVTPHRHPLDTQGQICFHPFCNCAVFCNFPQPKTPVLQGSLSGEMFCWLLLHH